jgi:hypothetical protein
MRSEASITSAAKTGEKLEAPEMKTIRESRGLFIAIIPLNSTPDENDVNG